MNYLVAFIVVFLSLNVSAKERESYYQTILCSKLGGTTEYVLPDRARVDCVTASEAIEADFAHKWAEAIGQALFYSKTLDKAPAILLIVNDKSERYIKRFEKATEGLDIKLYIMRE